MSKQPVSQPADAYWIEAPDRLLDRSVVPGDVALLAIPFAHAAASELAKRRVAVP